MASSKPFFWTIDLNGVPRDKGIHQVSREQNGVMCAMKFRWGLGPVFAFESLIAARRWQIYAIRSVYVSLLLLGLTLTWGPSERIIHSLAEAAAIGRIFFQTVHRRPARRGAAGRPGGDGELHLRRQIRGTLHHTFITDSPTARSSWANSGARLAPVLSLLAFGLPVLALGSFLGGIDFEAAIGAELVAAGTAVLCCSLAPLASVWARRPHQALLLSYTLVGVWVGFFPLVSVLVPLRPLGSVSQLVLYLSNPFCATFAPGDLAPRVSNAGGAGCVLHRRAVCSRAC